jgi:hypothetical protein
VGASKSSQANAVIADGHDQPEAPVQASAASVTGKRPLAITILAVYSLLLAIITFIPQLYYVLYAINPHVFPIGPNANPVGAIWFNYILGGQQGGYLNVDPGTLAGALEDAFMMSPLYLATGIGLLSLRRWVYPVGLITGSMIFYANLYFFLSGTLVAPHTTTDFITTILSSIPYFVYPLWLVPELLVQRSLFRR